ncbi:hypothetical protein EV122DRAFT_225663 [Schizophyllum commune]
MPRTKRTARVSVGGKFPRSTSNGAHPTIGKEQDTYSGTDPAAIYVRRSPRIRSKVSATQCPLADAGTHASRSSSAALQLIETAKSEQRTMADRWDSAAAGVHKQCDHKPVVPAVKSEGHSGGTTTSTRAISISQCSRSQTAHTAPFQVPPRLIPSILRSSAARGSVPMLAMLE